MPSAAKFSVVLVSVLAALLWWHFSQSRGAPSQAKPSQASEFVAAKMKQRMAARQAAKEAAAQGNTPSAALVRAGKKLMNAGDDTSAISKFEQALKLNPVSPSLDALSRLGGIMLSREKYSEAIDHLQRVALLDPGDAMSWTNLQSAFHGAGMASQAVEALRRAVDLEPANAEALLRLGTSYFKSFADIENAQKYFTQAEALDPEDQFLKLRNALMLPSVYSSQEQLLMARRSLEDRVSRISDNTSAASPSLLSKLDHTAMPGTFYVVYQGLNDRDLVRGIQSAYERQFPVLCEVADHLQLPPPPPMATPALATGGSRPKVRVGFVSPYWRSHSVCKLFCGIAHNLDRSKFEVVVFHGGSALEEDDMTTYGAANAKLVRVNKGFDLNNRHLLADQKLDVIVYSGLGMDTGEAKWAFGRMAPVQVYVWGHPHTSGMSHMDYFITSELFEPHPAAQQRFTEQLVRFSSLNFFFKKQAERADALLRERPLKSSIPGLAPALRSSLESDSSLAGSALSVDDIPLVLCPQTLYKFHPEYDRILARILEGTNARLVIVYNTNMPLWKKVLHERLAKTIDDSRLIFLPHMASTEYSRMMYASEVILDPFPFGGGVTTLDAFAVCRPVVTLPSAQNVPQLAAGMLRKMNLSSYVADTEQEYIDMARRLLVDTEYRDEFRRSVCERNDVLYSDSSAVQEWEKFLLHAAAAPR
jgi:predicted O-linked N-acetylglucosamine transferase (SPINDLY family)